MVCQANTHRHKIKIIRKEGRQASHGCRHTTKSHWQHTPVSQIVNKTSQMVDSMKPVFPKCCQLCWCPVSLFTLLVKWVPRLCSGSPPCPLSSWILMPALMVVGDAQPFSLFVCTLPLHTPPLSPWWCRCGQILRTRTHTLLKVPASEEVIVIKKAAPWLGPIPVLQWGEGQMQSRPEDSQSLALPKITGSRGDWWLRALERGPPRKEPWGHGQWRTLLTLCWETTTLRSYCSPEAGMEAKNPRFHIA